MEIYIYRRFYALEGKQGEATEVLEEVLASVFTRSVPSATVTCSTFT